MSELPNPPQWAQRLLSLTLRPRDQHTVAGDLLEEYRERGVGGTQRHAADVWYFEQVASLVWVAMVPAAVLLAAAIVNRVAVPSLPLHVDRTTGILISAGSAVGAYSLAGVYSGWCTRRLRATAVMFITAVAIGLIGYPTAALAYRLVWQRPPGPVAMRISGGHLVLLVLPELPLGLLLSIAGGLVGRFLISRPHGIGKNHLTRAQRTFSF
jgi:hypothetical protein